MSDSGSSFAAIKKIRKISICYLRPAISTVCKLYKPKSLYKKKEIKYLQSDPKKSEIVYTRSDAVTELINE